MWAAPLDVEDIGGIYRSINFGVDSFIVYHYVACQAFFSFFFKKIKFKRFFCLF
jgi:hypothetical protein